MAVSQAYKVTRSIQPTLDIVGKYYVVIGMLNLPHQVIPENHERKTFGGEKLEKVGGVCTRQNHTTNDVAPLHDIRQVKVLTRDMDRVIQ